MDILHEWIQRRWCKGSGPTTPVKNHKLLYVSLEIMVRIPSRSNWTQLLLEGDPYRPLLNTLMTRKVFIRAFLGIVGQVWCLVVSIPDFCSLSYFVHISKGTFSCVEILCKIIIIKYIFITLASLAILNVTA